MKRLAASLLLVLVAWTLTGCARVSSHDQALESRMVWLTASRIALEETHSKPLTRNQAEAMAGRNIGILPDLRCSLGRLEELLKKKRTQLSRPPGEPPEEHWRNLIEKVAKRDSEGVENVRRGFRDWRFSIYILDKPEKAWLEYRVGLFYRKRRPHPFTMYYLLFDGKGLLDVGLTGWPITRDDVKLRDDLPEMALQQHTWKPRRSARLRLKLNSLR